MAYILSYYAIACAFFLAILNWLLVGLFAGSLDSVYLESWKVFLSMMVVFTGLNNVSFCVSDLKSPSRRGCLLGLSQRSLYIGCERKASGTLL